MAVAHYLVHAWPPELPYTHFPAGELRNKAAAGKLKALGLKPGWPDFQFILPNGQAAFVELKAAGGKLSDVQIDVRAKLVTVGCGYAICRSLDEVEEALGRWLAKFGLALRAHLTAGGTVRITRPDAPLFAGAGG